MRVISRCKDELVSPEQYLAAADAAFAAAMTEEEREEAERGREIAEIYRAYEDALKQNDAVDFGDLIRLALQLVQNNADVRKYLAGFKHVLVDEFQDVNAASDALLRAICSTGADVWVVADERQSIYRFRGAEPSNVSRFTATFGGNRHALAINYRSFAPVVRLFERFSGIMGQGNMKGSWKAHRAEGGEVSLMVSPTVAAEGEAIRHKIEQMRKKGLSYKDQVILARSHLTLARITAILEQLGVPLLYLGDLFERREIRDLLSLVALGAEFGGVGLVRVAGLTEYHVPREDSLQMLRWCRANHVPVLQAFDRLSEIEALSSQGRDGLTKLGAHLQGLSNASPWTMLTAWLFERSEFLRPMLSANDAAAQQQLVAIYQLLKVCGEYIAMGGLNRRKFLARIRRIEALNEDTAYRAVSSEATDTDAVRVMTIHGSKGLEFPVVHLPALATPYMPSNWRGVQLPPPASLARLAMDRDDHEAEEQCLFFVALSRARDHLSLSRAEKYTTRNAKMSKFLTSTEGAVPCVQYPGSGKSFSNDEPLRPPLARECYPGKELDVYTKCPARYRYEVIEELRGGGNDSAYLGFHRCVYLTIGWLEEERRKGNTVNDRDALAQLAEVWSAEGPVNHAFEGYYRSAADSMVKGMVEAISSESAQYDRQEWVVPVGGKKILITPDRVLIDADGNVRVQRIRTGRRTKSESEHPVYALLRRGAAIKYPGRRVVIEMFYLATRERLPVPGDHDEKLLEKYERAIEGIESGGFHAVPDNRRCPNCQCYFMCGG